MSIEIDALEGGFAAAAGWWDRLLESSHRPSPFASHAWLGRWWEVYGEGARLLLVRLRDGTREVGGGAFYIRTRRLKGLLAVRELRLVGDRLVGSEGLDLLVAERGLEGEAACALGHFLTSIERGWDVAHLQGLRPGAVLLLPEAVGDSASVSISGVNRCPFLRLQTGRPVAPLRKHFASRVARKSRRLIDREGMRFARCTSEAECETLLDALFALHQRRWRTRGERGGFAARAKRDFYRLVSPDLLRAGRLEPLRPVGPGPSTRGALRRERGPNALLLAVLLRSRLCAPRPRERADAPDPAGRAGTRLRALRLHEG